MDIPQFKTVGLIAGQGDFPLLIAQAAEASGTRVIALAIKGFASEALQPLCTTTHWLELGQLNKAIEVLKSEKVGHLLMAGRVPHNNIFQYRHFDWRAMKLLARAASKRADALLQTVCDEFAREGIEIINSAHFLSNLMPSPGLLTVKRPFTEQEQADAEFGIPIAKTIAGQDIGQTIVVKDKMVVAVEGAEGTDKCILRAGELVGPGCVVIKVSKPAQDLRFDIPIVGPGTMKSMRAAGATALAFSSGRSLLFHKDEVLELAGEANIGIVVFEDGNTRNV